jgi:hypothetical protein
VAFEKQFNTTARGFREICEKWQTFEINLTQKDIPKNLQTIRGFTKSTDLVIRTKKLIKKSHETVPLSKQFF